MAAADGCCGARSFLVIYRATLDVPDDLVSWLENLIATRRS
ncbi:hypothetical protein [Streptomyces sp. NPDC057557]